MQVIKEGSVRVDLCGGTLDLEPIHLILPQVVTLNLATELRAKVIVEDFERPGILFQSLDYQSESYFSSEQIQAAGTDHHQLGPLRLLGLICAELKITSGLKIISSSGSPPGAGLGGSSAMGIVLYQALLEKINQTKLPHEIIKHVRNIEAKVLDCGPTGYQDYYPAVYGGILALKAKMTEIQCEQLYNSQLAQELEKNIHLIYSGETRLSAINNWEVYKAFFDGDGKVRKGLKQLADVSYRAYEALKNVQSKELIKLIGEEGKIRQGLFSGLMSPKMRELEKKLKEENLQYDFKICGAGGGGCFLLLGPQLCEKTQTFISSLGMSQLDFHIHPPVVA